jgi:tetratricopeptide (TPR) repeat protein
MGLRKKSLGALSFLACAVLAGYLSFILEPAIGASSLYGEEGTRESSESISLTLMGQFRMLLGNYFWLRTDDYTHFGILHNSYTRVKLENSLAQDFLTGGRGAAPKARDWRGIFKHFDYIHPVKGIHGDPRELLPWYLMQTRINPYDTAAYVNGAFFLADLAKNPEEGLAFLMQGAQGNPESPEIHQAIGRLYYDKWKKYDEAIPHLEKAISAGKEMQDRDEAEDEAIADAYLFLARAYRDKGELERALLVAEEGVVEYPENALVATIHRVIKNDMKNQGE